MKPWGVLMAISSVKTSVCRHKTLCYTVSGPNKKLHITNTNWQLCHMRNVIIAELIAEGIYIYNACVQTSTSFVCIFKSSCVDLDGCDADIHCCMFPEFL